MRKLTFALALILLVALIIFLFQNREKAVSVQPPLTPTLPSFTDADYTVTIPDKALIKNYLSVSLETTPGTVCKLTFIPPSGDVREMETTADADSQCKWRWKIEETDGRGHARLIFTVNGVSDTHFIDIRPGF